MTPDCEVLYCPKCEVELSRIRSRWGLCLPEPGEPTYYRPFGRGHTIWLERFCKSCKLQWYVSVKVYSETIEREWRTRDYAPVETLKQSQARKRYCPCGTPHAS